MEDTKKAQQPKKLLSELQEEMISTLNKLVASMERNADLLQENLTLKEKMHKMELEECNTIHIVPVQNGSAN